MDGNVYGYARVAEKECDETTLAILADSGAERSNIYTDTQSDKSNGYPAYRRLLRKLKPGDTVVIQNVGQLGRNAGEMLTQWQAITKDIQAFVVVLDMPLLDTRQKVKELSGVLISGIILQLLRNITESERAYAKRCQSEGIALAKAKGVRFGKPPLTRPESFPFVRDAWAKQEISARRAAKELGITHRTFLTWANEGEQTAKDSR